MEKGKRIVVKIGTSSLTAEGGSVNLRRIDELAKVLSGVRNTGNSVVLVSSGAVLNTATIGSGCIYTTSSLPSSACRSRRCF